MQNINFNKNAFSCVKQIDKADTCIGFCKEVEQSAGKKFPPFTVFHTPLNQSQRLLLKTNINVKAPPWLHFRVVKGCWNVNLCKQGGHREKNSPPLHQSSARLWQKALSCIINKYYLSCINQKIDGGLTSQHQMIPSK